METFDFVLGILTTVAFAIVVGVVVLIIRQALLEQKTRSLQADVYELCNEIERVEDAAYKEIERVEGLVNSRLDKLYDRVQREFKKE